MLKKIGINTSRAKKNGPNVKDGISRKKFAKVVVCSCGAKLEKSCENEYVCDISVLLCPKCGKQIS
jgi:hypothetical protein